MTIIELKRLETSPGGTIGVLIIDKTVMSFTLEPPKKNNVKNISCIPTGQYFCKIYNSKKFKCMCIGLHNVYNREWISIHPGNLINDTDGCILPGEKIGYFKNGKRAVHSSRHALETIIINCKNIAILTIIENF